MPLRTLRNSSRVVGSIDPLRLRIAADTRSSADTMTASWCGRVKGVSDDAFLSIVVAILGSSWVDNINGLI